MKSNVLVCLMLAACTASPEPRSGLRSGGSAPSSPAPPVASATKSQPGDAGLPTESPAPKGTTGWKSVPRAQGGFYVALDGLCSKLGFDHLGTDLVLYYGGTSATEYERSGAASFIALKNDTFVSIGAPPIQSPTGIAGRSLDSFWLADSTGSRSSEGAVLHRFTGGAWKQYPKDQSNLHDWVEGSVIGTLGFASSELWVEGSSHRPPASLSNGLFGSSLAAFPTGEVVLVGSADDKTLIARHWSKATGVKQYPLAMLGERSWVRFVEVSPTELYVWSEHKVARWNGTSWKLLGTTRSASPIQQAVRGAPNELWVLLESGAMQRSTDAGFVDEKSPEPIVSFDGFEHDAAWIVGKSGKVYRRDGGAWKNVPLPAPAFSVAASMKAKRVVVSAKDDVAFVAQYWESGLGWKERELHHALVRTRPVAETLRCNEPDPENNNAGIGFGFQSWPPLADASCTTPFVVLARRSKASKKAPSDWPKLRAAFENRPELGPVTLVELTSGDRTFVGAKVKDLETGKAMAKLAMAKDRLRPEVVCGEPVVTRSIPFARD